MEPQGVGPLDYATPRKSGRTRGELIVIWTLFGVAAGIGLLGFMLLFFKASMRVPAPGPMKVSKAVVTSFQNNAVGSAPAGFTTALTGGGGAVAWVVVEDEGLTVVAQKSADSTGNRFPLCVLNDVVAKDVEVSTRFKAISGEVDQAGGLVVRYQDKDNYYVVRANALEDNVRLYRVVGGKRTQIAGADVKVTAKEWHRLKLGARGPHFQVFFEDRLLFEAEDSTISQAGRVGFWTKADSVTEFEGLEVKTNE